MPCRWPSTRLPEMHDFIVMDSTHSLMMFNAEVRRAGSAVPRNGHFLHWLSAPGFSVRPAGHHHAFRLCSVTAAEQVQMVEHVVKVVQDLRTR